MDRRGHPFIRSLMEIQGGYPPVLPQQIMGIIQIIETWAKETLRFTPGTLS
jgi:hypothetical protein